MTKHMLIDAVHPEETRVVILDRKDVIDFDFASSAKKQIKGNIYLAKITRVEPSLQAAFVEYGGGRQGFLPFAEIHADYYQIPASDRLRLLEEAAREAEADDEYAERKPQGETAQNEQAQSVDLAATDLAATDSTDNFADNNNNDNNNDNNNKYNNENNTNADGLAAESANSQIPSIPLQATTNHQESAIVSDIVENISAADLPAAITTPEAPELSASTDNIAAETVSSTETISTAAPRAAESTENSEALETVETISSEEEEIRIQRRKRSFFKRYKIQDVIRRGQIVLVQVIKEERGNKGASLTTYLSLAGRYCVLMPNSPKDGGISRKIASPEDRKRLKVISDELRLAEGMSVIIRTAGMDRPRAEIKRDFDYLVKLWNHIREVTLQSTAPATIYEESDIIKRTIRDSYKNDVDDVIVQGQSGFEAARDFMQMILPSHTAKVKLYNESTPLFYAYDVEDQLMSMHDPVVKLRSGGYIVINPTEALISIDVNSGRATGERNIEETAFKTNMEAAVEVARQLRLRDLAGLIVIDFIDMLEARNRRGVEKALKDVLKADRAKIQLGRISPFGLLEMSRQRLRPSISETSMVQCTHCEGRGYIRSGESISIQIIRALEKEASSGNWSSVRLIASQTVALYLLNNKREALRALEQRHNVTVQVAIDINLPASEFNLEKIRRSVQDRGGNKRFERNRPADNSTASSAYDTTNNSASNSASNSVNNLNNSADSQITENSENEFSANQKASDDNSDNANSNNNNRSRNRRGRRGGRNRNNNYRQSANYQAEENPALSDTASDLNSDINEANAGAAVDDNVVSFRSGAEEYNKGNDNKDNNKNNNYSETSQNERPRRNSRGRNRWRNREQNDSQSANSSYRDDAKISETSDSRSSAAYESQVTTLPAFTQRPALAEPSNSVNQNFAMNDKNHNSANQNMHNSAHNNVHNNSHNNAPNSIHNKNHHVVNMHGDTPRDPSMPTKKGWWQRMISLED